MITWPALLTSSPWALTLERVRPGGLPDGLGIRCQQVSHIYFKLFFLKKDYQFSCGKWYLMVFILNITCCSFNKSLRFLAIFKGIFFMYGV